MKIIQNALKIEEKFSDVPNSFRVGPKNVTRHFFFGPYKAGPNPLLLLPLTFAEVSQVPIHCWMDNERFAVVDLTSLEHVEPTLQSNTLAT